MSICNSSYNIQLMSGEVLPFTFSYLLDFEMKHFKISFISELRKQFKSKNISFDQIKLFDKDESQYFFNYIPEDNYFFKIFIDESSCLTEEEIDYYKNWDGGEYYRTYLIWCEKNNNILKYKAVYRGAGENYIMSGSFTDSEWFLFIRSLFQDSEPLWDFIDEKSHFRYIYETGKTSIY